MFKINSFFELIGSKTILTNWYDAVKNIAIGEIVFIYGYSGTGKTCGTRLLVEEFKYNSLFLDTSICNDGKDIYDRILKFHQWSSLVDQLNETPNLDKKIIIIDELESFFKADRNILNIILNYIKLYKNESIPIVLIGDTEIAKKLGDIKNFITTSLYLSRLQDSDVFLFLKKHLPKNKIKLNELMKIAEDANGNINIAIQTIECKLNNKKLKLCNLVAEEQRTFPEIFKSKNQDIIARLLLEDNWMHPLKIHENIIKLLNLTYYINFLKDYILFEEWNYKYQSDETIPFYYLSFIIIYYIQLQKSDGTINTMDFSKLLSYISTQKKYKKLSYTHDFPIEDIGLHWMQFIKTKK
jgi:hypothetical protein